MHTKKKIHPESFGTCYGAGHCPVCYITAENEMGCG